MTHVSAPCCISYLVKPYHNDWLSVIYKPLVNDHLYICELFCHLLIRHTADQFEPVSTSLTVHVTAAVVAHILLAGREILETYLARGNAGYSLKCI